MSFSMKEYLFAKRWEPIQRNKDGMRWIAHRFPIKGGISTQEIMVRNISSGNALLRSLKEKSAN